MGNPREGHYRAAGEMDTLWCELPLLAFVVNMEEPDLGLEYEAFKIRLKNPAPPSCVLEILFDFSD